MSRSVLLASTICLAAGAQSACHVAGCRDGDLACAMQDSDGSEPGNSSTTGGPTTADLTTGTDATTEPPPPTDPTTDPSSPTVEPPANCGNGVVEGDEPCDDGNLEDNDACLSTCEPARCGDGLTQFGVEDCDDGNDDDTDDCTNACKLARCGDNIEHPPFEECDQGLANNDKLYNGCTTNCKLGPRCGDAKVNGPETCDDEDGDPQDGCLDGCVEATSCLQIKTLVPDAASGQYRVWPAELGGDVDVLVWCEMEADGGGYTYLKVDVEVDGASDKGAKSAELLCQGYGMHLFVPRTVDHLASAYAFATKTNLAPVGGGIKPSGADYLSILAIYPEAPGAVCGPGKGLNSVDCPTWQAWDTEPYWVTDTAVPGEPSDEHCMGCSMLYKWNLNGTLKSYTTFPSGEGAGTYRFLCDIADKF